MTTLLHERGTLGFALGGALEVQVTKLVALAKERAADDPLIRDRVAQEWIELQALKLTNNRSLTKLMQTGIPGPEGSGSKLHWSEQNQRLTKLAMEILEGEDDGYWRYQQLRSRGNTIEAGTSEILRNIIAERVLGLPRRSLMQFAFTEEQERCAARRATCSRTAAGRRTRSRSSTSSTAPSSTRRRDAPDRGEEFFDRGGVGERAARGALARSGRHRVEGARARARVREDARAVRQADRHVPGRVAPALEHVRRDGARALARVLGRVVRRRGRRAGRTSPAPRRRSYCGDAAVAACERSIQVHGGIGFTWEHVLHVYYKRALWIQAHHGYASKHRARIAAYLLD